MTCAGSALQGQRLTLSVQPDSGYKLDVLKVNDGNGNEVILRDLGGGKYEFTMPASIVNVTVVFVPDAPEIVLNPEPMPFTDVASESWFYGSVDYVWKHYLMSGVSPSLFAPGGTTSRAMLWTILARMHGVSIDTAIGAAPWYEQSMLWVMRQGVSNGTDPTGSVTREQIAVMLWRDAGSPDAAADLSSFGDNSHVSNYAQDAMRWAVTNGIMQGSGGMLNPKNTASRAEMAAIIARYAEWIG